jgi:GST-like protein
MADEMDPSKNMPPGYVPPKVWTWDQPSGGQFANINRPISGATAQKELPVGKHKLQLHSTGTPNGVKATIMLEELLAAGHDAEYDAWLIRIGEGDQFGSGFVAINPNSKIPALLDRSTDPPTRVFESGSILVYLAEKFGNAFLPTEHYKRTETFNWLMWQMGSAPFVGGGFGHFYVYAPIKIEYAINRYAMETKRQLHVLDTHLAKNEYMAGDEYTIADMAIWPWYGSIMTQGYGAQEFLSVHEYTNLKRWVDQVGDRPAVNRGRRVNTAFGPEELQLPERHDASDIDRALKAWDDWQAKQEAEKQPA